MLVRVNRGVARASSRSWASRPSRRGLLSIGGVPGACVHTHRNTKPRFAMRALPSPALWSIDPCSASIGCRFTRGLSPLAPPALASSAPSVVLHWCSGARLRASKLKGLLPFRRRTARATRPRCLPLPLRPCFPPSSPPGAPPAYTPKLLCMLLLADPHIARYVRVSALGAAFCESELLYAKYPVRGAQVISHFSTMHCRPALVSTGNVCYASLAYLALSSMHCTRRDGAARRVYAPNTRRLDSRSPAVHLR